MSKLSNLALVGWGVAATLAFSGLSFAGAGAGAATANITNGKNIYANGKRVRLVMVIMVWVMMTWALPSLPISATCTSSNN
jgi:hypothetical protein